jgi:hypothetical protein
MYLALTYTSRSRHFLTEEMRLRLLRQCELCNVSHGITGLMLYQQGRFVQYIEGLPETVRAVYTKICADSRHTEIELINEEVILERRFPEWSMLYRDYDFLYPHIWRDNGELLTLAKVIDALSESPELWQMTLDFMQQTHDAERNA